MALDGWIVIQLQGQLQIVDGGGIVRQMLPSFTKSTKWWRDSDVHTVPRAGTHKRGATCLNSLEFSEASIVPHRTIWSWYSGRWWVGCYIWYSKQGTGRGRSQSRPLLAVGLPSVTAHSSTASTYDDITVRIAVQWRLPSTWLEVSPLQHWSLTLPCTARSDWDNKIHSRCALLAD